MPLPRVRPLKQCHRCYKLRQVGARHLRLPQLPYRKPGKNLNPTKWPRPKKNTSISDEASVVVVVVPTLCGRDSRSPPMFVQNKDRWSEIRALCATYVAQTRNFDKGLKMQAATIADFRQVQNLLVTK
ncbi:hypothetical protein EVAR_16289_1 [Eumeta japonica]|uniref:Uncharacterized protein n=1 Tax=Eumeta variegata TaxID=151549 RepID=A0A4C1ZY71_EUMVA|nr:hypothetical protein EVAR_16289_1 [Eumeta japonica]